MTRICFIGLVWMILAAVLYVLFFVAVRVARHVSVPGHFAIPHDVGAVFGRRS